MKIRTTIIKVSTILGILFRPTVAVGRGKLEELVSYQKSLVSDVQEG